MSRLSLKFHIIPIPKPTMNQLYAKRKKEKNAKKANSLHDIRIIKNNLFGCIYTNKINILRRKSRIRVGLWVWPHKKHTIKVSSV